MIINRVNKKVSWNLRYQVQFRSFVPNRGEFRGTGCGGTAAVSKRVRTIPLRGD